MVNQTQIYNAGNAAQWRRIVFGDDDETITIASTVVFTGSVSMPVDTFTGYLKSVTGVATPSTLAATQFTGFASTVSGAALMGYGTTGDVSLMNRAGTVAAYVQANTVNTVLESVILDANDQSKQDVFLVRRVPTATGATFKTTTVDEFFLSIFGSYVGTPTYNLGGFEFEGLDASSGSVKYGLVEGIVTTNTAGATASYIQFGAQLAGVFTNALKVAGDRVTVLAGGLTVNTGGISATGNSTVTGTLQTGNFTTTGTIQQGNGTGNDAQWLNTAGSGAIQAGSYLQSAANSRAIQLVTTANASAADSAGIVYRDTTGAAWRDAFRVAATAGLATVDILPAGGKFQVSSSVMNSIRAVVSGSNVTTTSQSAASVTGLSFAIAANEVWIVKVHMKVGSSSAAGIQVAVSFPASATVTADWFGTTLTNGTNAYEQTTASGTLTTTSFDTLGATTAAVGAFVDGRITVINSTNAGTVQIQFAKTTSGTATVYAGSHLTAHRQA